MKLRLLDDDDGVVGSADLGPLGPEGPASDFERFVIGRQPVDAIGHRIVHGGSEFRESVVVTPHVIERLEAVSHLAPLHNPLALTALAATLKLTTGVPNIACFDTAFHVGLPAAASTYAIPRSWGERLGVRRYGFHGLSHAYASKRSADLLERPIEEVRIVTCHLGAGASLAAVAFGRSVDTTMGFTPLEGLVMATRSGSVDPGALLWIQQTTGISAAEMERVLEAESGLLALCDSADMRVVVQRSESGDERARLALDTYVHRVRAGIAAMAAAMGGSDAIVFSGGVGEGSATVRREACAGLGFVGVELDVDANDAVETTDSVLSTPGATTAVLVVHAREEVEIAREVRALVG